MIYFFIALGASIIGAISGLGGGVIIKPLLDLAGDYSVSTISILSSFTVFAMAVASLVKHYLYKTKIETRRVVLLAIGSIIGGNVGNWLFQSIVSAVERGAIVTLAQNGMLIVLLGGVLLYMNYLREKISFHVKNPLAIIIVGVVLGTISSFLGIGGGPINVVVLAMLFSMDTKSATVNSIFLIFFSQASKLVTIGLEQGYASHNLEALIVMIPAGIIGGIVGAKLNKKISSSKMVSIFNGTVVFVMLVCVFNAIKVIFL